jgi:hypothetical protein
MIKIHYKHTQLNYHACGVKISSLSKITRDLNQVTCKKCLKTLTGKKAVTQNK